ncbi:hypothetical protein [Bradyrhizobium centrosematis]|uniref:hypothetical protein n=1 Tax=Bradyrhizobium centrosematis TaxID=1300039 RepID=UPI00388DC405
MRAILAMGLVIVLCTAASAAPAHRARAHHPNDPAVDRSGAEVNPRVQFAVPGWSDEATQRWLNSASSNVGRGG